ncbi:MAG: peptidase M1, partial [Acidimicrobiales bacterium]
MVEALTPSCPAIPARAEPPPDRPRYDLTVDVRPADNEVVGETRVRFTPDLPTDMLVFRLWPNGPRLA